MPEKFLRRVGAVLEIRALDVRVWINGVTPAEGEWVGKEFLPLYLHHDEATFDVWLYDGQPIKWGAYTRQLIEQTQ